MVKDIRNIGIPDYVWDAVVVDLNIIAIHFNWIVQFNTVTTVTVKGKLLEIIEIDVVRVVVQEENNK